MRGDCRGCTDCLWGCDCLVLRRGPGAACGRSALASQATHSERAKQGASVTGGRSPFGIAEFLAFWGQDARRRSQLVILLCAIWLAFFGAQWFRVQKVVAGGQRALGITAENTYLPPGPVLRIVSLGNQSFLGDLIYIQATHYFIRHLVTDSQLPWLDLYLEAIWSLDANNHSSYRWGSQVVKFGQRIDREVSERANRFARLGLAVSPNDPWLFHEIAFNLRYAMDPRDEAESTYFRELSVRYLEIAYTFPNFVYDPNYLAAQYARAGQVDESIKSALVNYSGGTDDQRRELRNMLTERDRGEEAAQLAWLDVLHQRDWPYLQLPLSTMIGPKRVLAPPLNPASPEGWLRTPETPKDLLERLTVRFMVPTPDERPDPAEWHVDPPPAPTASTAQH